MSLTKEQIETYVDRGGDQCPYCGSAWFTLGRKLDDACRAFNHCAECGAEWRDQYTLVGLIELDGTKP